MNNCVFLPEDDDAPVPFLSFLSFISSPSTPDPKDLVSSSVIVSRPFTSFDDDRYSNDLTRTFGDAVSFHIEHNQRGRTIDGSGEANVVVAHSFSSSPVRCQYLRGRTFDEVRGGHGGLRGRHAPSQSKVTSDAQTRSRLLFLLHPSTMAATTTTKLLSRGIVTVYIYIPIAKYIIDNCSVLGFRCTSLTTKLNSLSSSLSSAGWTTAYINTVGINHRSFPVPCRERVCSRRFRRDIINSIM